MVNILKHWIKNGVVVTGSDNVELDTPSFQIVDVQIDTVNSVLHVEIMHEVAQGSLTQKHSRSFDVPFGSLTTPIKQAGKEFLDAIEAKILTLPQYQGAVEQQ